jgi:NAD(P)-dependent dehydrogenase (short-subunit alcohol dehydrogenase family)
VTTVGIVTGAGRGMGAACATHLVGDVDVLILADRDASAILAAADSLSAGQTGTQIIPFELDVVHKGGLARLAREVADAGTLRAVVHAAGVSPTMAQWRDIIGIDLIGSARLLEALRPAVTTGTAIVCFASMAPFLLPDSVDSAIDAALDEPLES